MNILKQLCRIKIKNFFVVYCAYIFNLFYCVNLCFADYEPIFDNVKQMAINSRSCLITHDNTLYCWGRNQLGQIGDGTKTDKPSPVKVLEDVKSVSIGDSYACALKISGDLYCWGMPFDTYNMQTGYSSTKGHLTPVLVLSGVASVNVDNTHACALKTNGELYCWGQNDYGQIGNGTVANQKTPKKVMNNVVEFYLGGARSGQTCAIKKSGDLYCWGLNNFYYSDGKRDITRDRRIDSNHLIRDISLSILAGLIEDVTQKIKSIFTKSNARIWKKPFKIFTNAKELDLNSRCVLKTTGELFCWIIGNGITPKKSFSNVKSINGECALYKNNDLYCLGKDKNGITRDFNRFYKPTFSRFFSNIKNIYNNESDNYCVINYYNSLYCFERNDFHSLAYGTNISRLKVSDDVLDVKMWSSKKCIIKTDGKLYCQRDKKFSNIYTPTQVLTDIKQTELGIRHACAISLTGDLYCWGDNTYGQIGNGEENVYQIKPIKILEDVKDVVVKQFNTCAINNSDELFCWGRNNDGQIGIGTKINKKTPYKVLSDVKQADISLSRVGMHICAVKKSGDLFCWGSGGWGQLGNGSRDTQTLPIRVMTGISRVGVAEGYTCGLKETGELYCWGSYLRHGFFSAMNYQATPILVLEGIKDFVLDSYHTCAINNLDEVYCWGAYDGNYASSSTKRLEVPTKIMDNVSKVSLANALTCVINKDGVLYCWAESSDWRLGNGSQGRMRYPNPFQIMTGVRDIITTDNHVCAISTSNELTCWGNNNVGQIGGEGFRPYRRNVLNNIYKVNANSNVTCSIDNNHILKCWGKNHGGFIDGKSEMTDDRLKNFLGEN